MAVINELKIEEGRVDRGEREENLSAKFILKLAQWMDYSTAISLLHSSIFCRHTCILIIVFNFMILKQSTTKGHLFSSFFFVGFPKIKFFFHEGKNK